MTSPLNVFLLEVDYKGPYSNFCESLEANKALDNAMKDLNDLLKRCEIEEKHAYCWPDGSLYRKIRTSLGMMEAWKLISSNNVSENLKSFQLHEDVWE